MKYVHISHLLTTHRWRIYLTPGVKRPTLEPFNEYETAIIYLGQLVHGNQWSSIAKLLPGRTNTAIKNFWKTALATTEHKRVRNNRQVAQISRMMCVVQ